MTPEEARARAERARQLLNDEVLKESFDNAHAALLRAVKSSKTEHEAYKAAIALQVFDLIKNNIESHIETAKVIEFNFKDRKFGIF